MVMFAEQNPAVPFIVVGLFFLFIILVVVGLFVWLLLRLWKNRHNLGQHKKALWALLIVGLILLYESLGFIYDKIK